MSLVRSEVPSDYVIIIPGRSFSCSFFSQGLFAWLRDFVSNEFQLTDSIAPVRVKNQNPLWVSRLVQWYTTYTHITYIHTNTHTHNEHIHVHTHITYTLTHSQNIHIHTHNIHTYIHTHNIHTHNEHTHTYTHTHTQQTVC